MANAIDRLNAERLRHNMAVEELILFPAALPHFQADDWLAIMNCTEVCPKGLSPSHAIERIRVALLRESS